MRLRDSLTAVAAISILLAGCTGSSGSAATPTSGNEPIDVQVSDNTGAISGILISEEQVPIAAGMVGLRTEPPLETTTNEAGEFGFGDVAPGEYVLIAQALGYSPVTQTLTVVAGEITYANVMLIAQPMSGLPYTVVAGPIRGKFFCGFSLYVSGPCKILGFSDTSNPVEQQWSSFSGGERNIFEMREMIEGNRSHEDDLFSAAIVEITWNPTSASAQWLQASIEDVPESENARNLSEPTWNRTSGSSPLRMSLVPGAKAVAGTDIIPLEPEGFLVGVFPSADPAGPKTPKETPCPGAPVPCAANRTLGASAYTDQSLDLWITLFYNGAPDPGFSILPDA